MGTHIDPTEYTLLPTGSYPATITAVDEAEGQFGPQVKLTFSLGEVEDVDGNVESRTLTGYASAKLSARTKLWGWVLAAGLDPAEGLDTDDLIGRRVVLDVTIEPRTNGDGEFNAIHSLRKPKSKNGSKPARPAVEDDDEAGDL